MHFTFEDGYQHYCVGEVMGKEVRLEMAFAGELAVVLVNLADNIKTDIFWS